MYILIPMYYDAVLV